jgi:hypothetical protein
MDEKLREKLIRLLRDMAQQVADDAEKIVPDVRYWTDLNVVINIPTATDKPEDCPTISVSYSHFPKEETIKRLIYGGEEDGNA